MLKLSVRYMCPLILMMASPVPAWALCCPGDIKNHASAASGDHLPSTTHSHSNQGARAGALERGNVANYHSNRLPQWTIELSPHRPESSDVPQPAK